MGLSAVLPLVLVRLVQLVHQALHPLLALNLLLVLVFAPLVMPALLALVLLQVVQSAQLAPMLLNRLPLQPPLLAQLVQQALQPVVMLLAFIIVNAPLGFPALLALLLLQIVWPAQEVLIVHSATEYA